MQKTEEKKKLISEHLGYLRKERLPKEMSHALAVLCSKKENQIKATPIKPSVLWRFPSNK